MDNLFFSEKNYNFIKTQIYGIVKQKYNLDVNNKYDADIKKVMTSLWERNKDKSQKSLNKPGKFINALNEKMITLIVPQIGNSIVSGYESYSNNNLYTQVEKKPDQPQPENENADMEKAYAKILSERQYDGNIYSKDAYQGQSETYDNFLPPQAPDGNNLKTQGAGSQPIPNVNQPAPQIPETYNTTQPQIQSLPQQPTITQPATNNSEIISPEMKEREEQMRNTHKQTVMGSNIDLSPARENDARLNKENFEVKPKNTSNITDDIFRKRRQPQTSKGEYDEELKRQTNFDRAVSDDKEIDKSVYEQKVIDPKASHPEVINSEQKTQQMYQHELHLINEMSNNANTQYSLLPPQLSNYMKRPYFFIVDSLQRDFITYPSASNFQVKFEQPDDTVEIPSRLLPDGTIKYEKGLHVGYAGGKGAKLENSLKNILTLKVLDAQVPYDATYQGGKAPYKFNGPKTDENKLVANSFPGYPYGPIYQDDYGFPIDVLDEPYYFLVCNEIDGAYDGTTLASRKALAKLSYDKLYGFNRKFLTLKTTHDEYKYWHPTQLGELNQLTLSLVSRFNSQVNLGVDRIVISAIEEGEENTGKYCNLENGQHLTKITIKTDDPTYPEKVCSHGNFPGDKLLMYSVFSCNPLGNPIKFPDAIKIDFTNYPICKLTVQNDTKIVDVNVMRFLKVGDLFIINNQYILEVTSIDIISETYTATQFTVQSKISGFNPLDPVLQLGYVKKNDRGFQSDVKTDFTFTNGLRVSGEDSDEITFEVIYPFECLPDYLKSAPHGYYSEGEAFYLQAKKQITYTFEAVSIEQNANPLMSRIIT